LLECVLRSKSVFENRESMSREALLTTLEVLESVGSLPTHILSDTNIGKVLGQLSKNSALDSLVRERSRLLVTKWRDAHRKRRLSMQEQTEVSASSGCRTAHVSPVGSGESRLWRCGSCTLDNPASAASCTACEALRPAKRGCWSDNMMKHIKASSRSDTIDLSD
jgi:hypothetical protein